MCKLRTALDIQQQGAAAESTARKNIMSAKFFFRTLTAVLVLGCLPLLATGPQKGDHATPPSPEILPTGMSITPTAAKGSTFQPLNPDLPDLPAFTVDHPITTAISPDGNTLLVLTSGYNRNFDVKAKKIPAQSNEYVFVYDIAKQTPVKRQVLKIANTYVGLAWSPDGKRFYVSGGSDDSVHLFEQSNGTWTEPSEPIKLGHKSGLGIGERDGDKAVPNRPVAAGLAVSPNGARLLVANYANDSVSVIDLAARNVIAELDLRPGKNDPAQKGVPGGEYPYGVVFKGDDKAYVSSLRDREIVAVDLHAAPKIAGRIKVRGQPGKLILNQAQSLLFAAADNSDSVVIIDTRTDRVVAEIKTTAPEGIFRNRGDFKGSMPNSLALSPDEKTLYVTNGGTNSVAVITLDRDPDDSRVSGLIPTGWYPTSVSVGHGGSVLYIVNGKSNAGPNPGGCRNGLATSGDKPCALAQQYVWQLEKGGLSVMPRPSGPDLAALTLQVARNNHFLSSAIKKNDQSGPTFSFLRSKIKHVIYIVKENRTYDQVLGDLEKGNGDPKLALFPGPMSPNHHELARRFVTLDNFYDSGEVSGNGWNWSTAARATDLTERTIPMNYADRGLTYDVEGVNRGINVGARTAEDRAHGKLDDPDDQLPGTADVGAPDGPEDEAGAGYLWDSALRAGLSVRNYGFFANLAHYSATPEGGPPVPLLHSPAQTGIQVAFPANPRLQDITDLYFRSFDMRFADYWRFKEWEREFDDYVKRDSLPNLELLRLPRDHFGNFKEAEDGVNTVETQMADNDYALGLVMEKIAHSKYAHDTLIFVIEDDAQNGPDHVDAHRSIAYVVGPYVKQGAVVSQRYNTVSMLRTIEDVLGIKHLGLYDALQPPMTEVFSTKQNMWTYSARVPEILRTTKLPLPVVVPQERPGKRASIRSGRDANYWAEKTLGFDFSVEDKLDSGAFNLVLWNGLKGEDQVYPAERDGRDLSKNRRQLLEQSSRSPGAQ